MDHILEQSPISRPRTPLNFALPSPRISSSSDSKTADRRPCVVSDVINPLTGLPGATPRSRHASMSSGIPSPVQSMHERENSKERDGSLPSPAVPLPRTTTPGLILTSSPPEVVTSGLLPGDTLPVNPLNSSSKPVSRASSTETRQLQSADQLASRLPPHLQALRTTCLGINNLSSPFQPSPDSSPDREDVPHPLNPSVPPTGGALQASVSRKMSFLAMTPSDKLGRDRSSSQGGEHSSTNTPAGPPILVNPKCSGYFVEPVRWMR